MSKSSVPVIGNIQGKGTAIPVQATRHIWGAEVSSTHSHIWQQMLLGRQLHITATLTQVK
jgi:hypothetical protein